jgi:hypothetical protein
VLPTELWQKELNRIYSQRLAFMALINPEMKRIPWHRRLWNRLRYRVSEFRERLGELIAGRRFDDY